MDKLLNNFGMSIQPVSISRKWHTVLLDETIIFARVASTHGSFSNKYYD